MVLSNFIKIAIMKVQKVKYNRLDSFIIMAHTLDLEESCDIYYEWYCIYEEVEIYITSKKVIKGLKKHGLGYLHCYSKTKCNEENTIIMYNNKHIRTKEALEKTADCDAAYNCFGYCCFNSELWVDLTEENLSIFMSSNRYVETKDKPNENEDFIIVYYDRKGRWIHIGKYDSVNKKYKHKLGSGNIVECLSEDISNQYKECDMSKSKYYVKKINGLWHSLFHK